MNLLYNMSSKTFTRQILRCKERIIVLNIILHQTITNKVHEYYSMEAIVELYVVYERLNIYIQLFVNNVELIYIQS